MNFDVYNTSPFLNSGFHGYQLDMPSAILFPCRSLIHSRIQFPLLTRKQLWAMTI